MKSPMQERDAVSEGQNTQIGGFETGRDLLVGHIAGPMYALLQIEAGDLRLDLGQGGNIGRIAGAGLPADEQQMGIDRFCRLRS